jgi:hypothetical protein
MRTKERDIGVDEPYTTLVAKLASKLLDLRYAIRVIAAKRPSLV